MYYVQVPLINEIINIVKRETQWNFLPHPKIHYLLLGQYIWYIYQPLITLGCPQAPPTSAIFITQVGESPDIAQTNTESYQCPDDLK